MCWNRTNDGPLTHFQKVNHYSLLLGGQLSFWNNTNLHLTTNIKQFYSIVSHIAYLYTMQQFIHCCVDCRLQNIAQLTHVKSLRVIIFDSQPRSVNIYEYNGWGWVKCRVKGPVQEFQKRINNFQCVLECTMYHINKLGHQYQMTLNVPAFRFSYDNNNNNNDDDNYSTPTKKNTKIYNNEFRMRPRHQTMLIIYSVFLPFYQKSNQYEYMQYSNFNLCIDFNIFCFYSWEFILRNF